MSRHPNARPDNFGAHITKNQKATIKVSITCVIKFILRKYISLLANILHKKAIYNRKETIFWILTPPPWEGEKSVFIIHTFFLRYKKFVNEKDIAMMLFRSSCQKPKLLVTLKIISCRRSTSSTRGSRPSSTCSRTRRPSSTSPSSSWYQPSSWPS